MKEFYLPFIVDIQTAYPEFYFDQSTLIDALCDAWKDKVPNLKRLRLIHENVKVDKRHIATEVDKYLKFENFDEKNNLYLKVATKIAIKSIESILINNNIRPEEIQSLWSNTVTGFAIPSLEARVMNHFDFSSKTKRVPLMGLGCMAGVAGLNRVADYLKGHPDEAALFFSAELCSLTFQLNDTSAANLVATGLFGDGAAAVLLVGDNHPLRKKAALKWEASESIFFKDSQDTMGWHVGAEGLKIILSKSVPDVVKNRLKDPMIHFLNDQNLNLRDISNFMTHPGGPKVLSAMEELLGLNESFLHHSWESLAQNGNMSSVSVLDIIHRTIQARTNEKPGEKCLAIAMGPGFSAEVGLYSWI